MNTHTVPAKVEAAITEIENSGNTVEVEVRVSDVCGTDMTFYHLNFNSIENHFLLKSFGGVMFRTYEGRTKFLGGSMFTATQTLSIDTYRDLNIIVDVYTSTSQLSA